MREPATGILAEYLKLNGRLREVVRSLDQDRLDRSLAAGENSIAVLVAHTIGSELSWLSVAAGRTRARDRDAEFLTRGRTSDELLRAIDGADAELPELVEAAVAAGVETVRTLQDGVQWTIARALAHSVAHTAEHVGHAELTRNLVAPDRTRAS